MIGRARLGLVGALALGIGLVTTQFPFAAIVHARSAVTSDAHELSRLQGENHRLSSQVSALRLPSVIARLAHESDGLVQKGERFEVVLPSRAATSRATASGEEQLGISKIPQGDIVPSDAADSPTAVVPSSAKTAFWDRLVQRLEFWKAVP
ncbi:MAG: hypothetical protein ACRDZ5_03245 [Acidimicrobiales bacterium]